MKICSRCASPKETVDFYRNSVNKDGLTGMCKECVRIQTKEYRTNNPEKVKRAEALRAKLPHRRALSVAWAIKNPERKRFIANRHARSDKAKQTHKRLRKANHVRYLEYERNYRKLYRERSRILELHKRHTDINYRVRMTLRSNLTSALRRQCVSKNRRPTLSFLGCSIPDFRMYLESKFEPGMSWENYSRNGWHVDHIMPCAIFDLSKESHVKRCFHFSNLQPMWAAENIRKSDNITTNQFNLL